jgi:hypothetical protein
MFNTVKHRTSGKSMLKNLRDKIALCGATVLSIGVALLIFTFVSAYIFLTQSPRIATSADTSQTFADTLPPLIATCIRIMYLGMMGWAASLMTIRGVTIITHNPQTSTPTPQHQPDAEQTTEDQKEAPIIENKEENPKREEKPQEPQATTISAEATPQPQLLNA